MCGWLEIHRRHREERALVGAPGMGRLLSAAADGRRPGFVLLVAETTLLVGCVLGFPVGPEAPCERGLHESVQRLTGRTGFLALGDTGSMPGA